jgi:hypothetical protein
MDFLEKYIKALMRATRERPIAWRIFVPIFLFVFTIATGMVDVSFGPENAGKHAKPPQSIQFAFMFLGTILLGWAQLGWHLSRWIFLSFALSECALIIASLRSPSFYLFLIQGPVVMALFLYMIFASARAQIKKESKVN